MNKKVIVPAFMLISAALLIISTFILYIITNSKILLDILLLELAVPIAGIMLAGGIELLKSSPPASPEELAREHEEVLKKVLKASSKLEEES
ncbi:hypothetical protein IPA_05500 [Ignicoccus pacificus DSM 13166]|uniref:Uncharacterized protein n=1 Tax=Ignicoccus pacificus DSM 13166 TaxID=940294 RepID=A0A977KBC2_9CREN|nr:hypothetical protein IPA_05500 [Ignicoccus pacificus DSM 13166]